MGCLVAARLVDRGLGRAGRSPCAISASRRLRNVGQVRVFGFRSAKSSARARSADPGRPGRRPDARRTRSQRPRSAEPASVSRQNLNAWWTAGKTNSSFSKRVERRRAIRRSTRSPKKNFVVSSVAMPVGRIDARPGRAGPRSTHQFGEDRVGVDVAASGQRVAARVAEEMALALGPPQCRAGTPAHSAGSVRSRATIIRLRSAAFLRRAISGLRSAKNSCSWSLTRSQGGFPSTTSNPPRSNTAGNSSGQWKKAYSAAVRSTSSRAAADDPAPPAPTATARSRS